MRIRELVQARKGLRGEQHVGAVFSQLTEHLLVVGAGQRVELVHDQRNGLSIGWREQRLSRDSACRQVEQRSTDQRSNVLADIKRIEIDQHDLVLRDELAE